MDIGSSFPEDDFLAPAEVLVQDPCPWALEDHRVSVGWI